MSCVALQIRKLKFIKMMCIYSLNSFVYNLIEIISFPGFHVRMFSALYLGASQMPVLGSSKIRVFNFNTLCCVLVKRAEIIPFLFLCRVTSCKIGIYLMHYPILICCSMICAWHVCKLVFRVDNDDGSISTHCSTGSCFLFHLQ